MQPEFVAQLAVGGVDGTLKHRFRGGHARRLVRAKTGTLEDVAALSGYVLSPSGRGADRVQHSDEPHCRQGRRGSVCRRRSRRDRGPDAGQRRALSRPLSRACACGSCRAPAPGAGGSARGDRLYLSPISLSVSSSSSSRPKRHRMMRDSIGRQRAEQPPDLVAPLLAGKRLVRREHVRRPAGSR